MRIHILGICGTFMAGLAQILKESGHDVTGADAKFYPPMSDYLKKIGIKTIEGYKKKSLPDADLYVIGNALSRGNECIEEILEQKLPYVSGPEMLGKELKNRNVIFDGFPRNLNQATVLDQSLKEILVSLDKAIFIDVNHEILKDRILKRINETNSCN